MCWQGGGGEEVNIWKWKTNGSFWASQLWHKLTGVERNVKSSSHPFHDFTKAGSDLSNFFPGKCLNYANIFKVET